jgi:hypothetical protein
MVLVNNNICDLGVFIFLFIGLIVPGCLIRGARVAYFFAHPIAWAPQLRSVSLRSLDGVLVAGPRRPNVTQQLQ